MIVEIQNVVATADLKQTVDARKFTTYSWGIYLKENVYKAIRIIAQGFVNLPGNKLKSNFEGQLREIQDNSMRLVYRLLFILYAEARGLLNNPSYLESDYSLYSLKHEITRKKTIGQQFVPTGTAYWARLRNLFNLISIGSEAYGVPKNVFYVPPYNGGLFEPNMNSFLEEKALGDEAVANVIDLLARTPLDTGRLGFVDYSTLEIRHLGSIYEGLLEYRITVADKRMVAAGNRKLIWTNYNDYIEDKKKPKPFDRFELEERAEPGEIYVGTHKGERKSTGSYYTPEPIVKLIIEDTIKPIINSKWAKAESEGKSLREATLSIRVLDPSMGSGHFLVGAVEHLATALLKAMELDIERGLANENTLDNYTPDSARREILAHCIYGVDLNPLAVELAKVSLWLMTISKNMPLSFLDHHLKCGNSLIGASVYDILWPPATRPKGATSQIDKSSSILERLVSKLEELGKINDDTIRNIKLKEDLLKQFLQSDEYKRIKLLADVHTGLWFTEYETKDIHEPYMKLVESVYSVDKVRDFDMLGTWFSNARTEAGKRNAFHWELEFPEIFVSTDKLGKEQGFDAVIGNPPYVSFGLGRVGTLGKSEERYFRFNFAKSAEYKISTYALFMELCIRLSAYDGFQGLILPDSFLIGKYFYKVRTLLLQNDIRTLLHFDKDFWESGNVGFPVVWIGQKRTPKEDFLVRFTPSLEAFVREEFTERKLFLSQIKKNRRHRIRLIRDENTSSIVNRIEEQNFVIEDYLSLHHGIRSKSGREQIVSRSPDISDKRWKKALVESNQVTRFHIDYREDFILVDKKLLFSGGWDPEKIEVPKILIRRTGDSIISCVDYDGFYHTNALIYGNLTQGSNPILLRCLSGTLNSNLFTYYYRAVTAKEGRTFPQVEIDSLEELAAPELTIVVEKDLEVNSDVKVPEYINHETINSLLIQIHSANATVKLQTLLSFLVERLERTSSQVIAKGKTFLEWLRVATESDLDSWAGKSILQKFGALPFQTLLDLVIQNEVQSKLQPSKRASDLQTLKDNFDTTTKELQPLIIERTNLDLLINLIVYKIYNISSDQIAWVEGSTVQDIETKYHWIKEQ